MTKEELKLWALVCERQVVAQMRETEKEYRAGQTNLKKRMKEEARESNRNKRRGMERDGEKKRKKERERKRMREWACWPGRALLKPFVWASATMAKTCARDECKRERENERDRERGREQ